MDGQKLDTQPLGITPTAACTRKQHALSSNSSKQQYSRQQCAFSTPCEQKITARPLVVCQHQRPSGNSVSLTAAPSRQCCALGNNVPSATSCFRQQCALGNNVPSATWRGPPNHKKPLAVYQQQRALGSNMLLAAVRFQRQCSRQQHALSDRSLNKQPASGSSALGSSMHLATRALGNSVLQTRMCH